MLQNVVILNGIGRLHINLPILVMAPTKLRSN